MKDQILTTLRSTAKNTARFFAELSAIRSRTSVRQYPDLFAKLRRVRPLGKNGLIPVNSPRLGALGPPPILKSLPLPAEVAWTAMQLYSSQGALAKHLDLSRNVAQKVGSNLFEEALELVDEHIEFFGETIWAIEARVAILSLLKDDDRLEAYRVTLEPLYGSVPHFLAYVFEDLFDEDSSLGGFQRRMSNRLGNLSRQDVKNYIETRCGIGSSQEPALADFLRISAWYSRVDAYEALITVLPHYISESDFNSSKTIQQALYPLLKLSDIRVGVIFNAFVGRATGADQDNSPVSIGKMEGAKEFPQLDKVAAIALCTRDDINSAGINSADFSYIEKRLLDALIPFRDKRNSLISTYEQLHTLIAKFRFLPWYQSMQAWVDALFLPIVGQQGFLWYFAASNLMAECDVDLASIITCLPWTVIYSGRQHLMERYCFVNNGLLSTTGKVPYQAPDCLDFPYAYGIMLGEIEACSRQNDHNRALQLSVIVAIKIPGSGGFLPFTEIFEDRNSWSDYEDFDLLDVVIGLYFASLGDRESRSRFLLEFACKKLLSVFENDWASQLLSHYINQHPQIVYILREILVPKNLRLVGLLKNVEQLENFRIDVCSTLLDVDKEFSDRYVTETLEILQLQELRKAEREVESSRIYVDREGIKKWAEKLHHEEFLRAKKGRTAMLAPSLEEIQSNLRDKSYAQDTNPGTALAANMRDPIFKIGYEIFTKCFWKEDDGLDHFLSLRIRHGSFVGYLRSPLEQAKLVGTGVANSDSRVSYWNAQLSRSAGSAVSSFLLALDKFQEDFDSLVEDFRNNFLQIATVEKPKGLFVPGLSKPVWDAFHSDWEHSRTFDNFFDAVWTAFQSTLERSLVDVATAIDERILHNCEIMMVELRRTVGNCGLNDSDRATATSALNEGGLALQEATRAVKKWFEINQNPISDTRLSARQVLELGTKLFKKIRPNFVIEVSPLAVPNHLLFDRSQIQRITDALFIIFDNVYKHSGFDARARVDLTFEFHAESESSGSIYIAAESEINQSVDTKEVNRRLEDVRALMESGEHRNALVNEGKTGLIKLAWLAASSKRPGKLEFALCENVFKVEISMATNLIST